LSLELPAEAQQKQLIPNCAPIFLGCRSALTPWQKKKNGTLTSLFFIKMSGEVHSSLAL
jgi:hypothetical protein